MSKIIQLQAENVKRLRAVSVKPDGSLVVIGGQNGQGKTSLLDSVSMAIGGKDMVPAEPLRRGAEKGHVEVTLDDGMVIRRTFTPGGGGALTVTSKDGSRFPSPQKLLDGLVGKLSFDPLGFSRMDPKAQAATLRELVGVDTTELEASRKAAYDQRTETSREVKRLEGALSRMPEPPPGTPEAEVSVDELAAELERRRAHNAAVATEQRTLEQMRVEAVTRGNAIGEMNRQADRLEEEFKARMAELQGRIRKAEEEADALKARGKEQAAKVAALVTADESEVLEQLKGVQATNAAVRAAAERKRLEDERKAQAGKVLDLTEAIAKAEAEKAAALAAVQLPVDGLAFDEAGVTLNGLPLEQASGAEQLRVSVAIGLALHPKLKVLLVRDGSLLDEDSLALVAKMAEDAGAQVWVERVGKGSECSVVIEDGQVAGAAAAPQPAAAKASAKPQQGKLAVVREPGEDG